MEDIAQDNFASIFPNQSEMNNSIVNYKVISKPVLQIKSVTPVMNGVGADLVEYIKSFPSNADFNAKDVI